MQKNYNKLIWRSCKRVKWRFGAVAKRLKWRSGAVAKEGNMAVRFLLMRVGVISNEQGRPVTIKIDSILHNAHSTTILSVSNESGKRVLNTQF